MVTGDHIAGRETSSDKLHTLDKHAHSESKCYPTLAAGKTVVGAGGGWGLGVFKEIVPVNTISDDFDIHYITVEGASVAEVYELVLYAVEVEIARVRMAFIDVANSQTLPSIPVQTPIIKKNTQIQAKVASSGGGGDTVTISLHYHTY